MELFDAPAEFDAEDVQRFLADEPSEDVCGRRCGGSRPTSGT